MSKDMQDAVNNFALGFSLGDKIMARRDAAEAAKQKWQTIAAWRAADLAEKARRNATYDRQAASHAELYKAQADWYRKRGAGGGAKVSSAGGPAYSPAGQQFIDNMNNRGLPIQGLPPSPSFSVEMPEQPPPMPPPLQPPSDSGSGFDPMGLALTQNDAEGGAIRTLPPSGTAGPGHGFGQRATPPPGYVPGMQDGGPVPKFQKGGSTPSDVTRQRILDWFRTRKSPWSAYYNSGAVGPEMIDVYGNRVGNLPPPPPPAPSPTPPTQPPAQLSTPVANVGPFPPRPEGDLSAQRPGSVPDNGPSVGPFPPRPEGNLWSQHPGPTNRGAIRTAQPWTPATDKWKALSDQTRVAAYDPVSDRLDPNNRMYVTDDYRVAPWAQKDWAARWNNQNLWGNPTTTADAPESGMNYAEGGDVLHGILGTAGWAAGHLVPFVGPPIGQFLGHTAANVAEGKTDDIGSDAAHDFSSPIPFLGGKLGDTIGGSKPAGVGDQIESTAHNPLGALKFGGGFGGDYSPDMGGVDPGDSGFTYRRGGRVPGYKQGGRVQRFADGGPTDPNSDPSGDKWARPGNKLPFIEPWENASSPEYVRGSLRYRYEQTALDPNATPTDKAKAWDNYKTTMRAAGYKGEFDDAQAPAVFNRDTVYDRSGRPITINLPGQPPADRSRGGTGASTEPDVPPQPGEQVPERPDLGPGNRPPFVESQGRPAPRRTGAIDTSRWKALDDQTRTAAYDPEKDLLDPQNRMVVDRTGRVAPYAQGRVPVDEARAPPADARARDAAPPMTAPQGGASYNAQGANAYGAGLSTNNAANDMTSIMKAASDFAAHTFHLTQNDEHSAGGYHALMTGHGAAPINMIADGFNKIDPTGQMPIHQKMELLAEHVYDYWVGQGQPDKAGKVAFEVSQFGNKMAQQHGRRALDLFQNGDMHGAAVELVGGYNWLVDGHTADYDPRTQQIILRDSKTGRPTGNLKVTPALMHNFGWGMSSGELNWDIMRGRGQAAAAGQPPPQSRSPAQPQTADAGLTFENPPVVTPEQGGGESTQPTQSPQRTKPSGALDTRTPTRYWDPNTATYKQRTATPAQGDRTDQQGTQQQDPNVEGSDAWYEKNPHATPNHTIFRNAPDMDQSPDFRKLYVDSDAQHNAELKWINDQAKGLAKQDKPLVAQAIAQENNRYNKEREEIKAAEKSWADKVRQFQQQESQRTRDWQARSENTENNLEQKFETILAKQQAAYEKLDPVKTSEMARSRKYPDEKSRMDVQNFSTVHQSPLRYMKTPEDRAHLKELATKIIIKNPGMSEREALEHAMTFTSFVGDNDTGFNRAKGENGTRYRHFGRDTLGNIVLQNEAHENVHVDKNTLQQIDNLRRANRHQFYNEYVPERAKTLKEEKERGGMYERTGKFLRNLTPLTPLDPFTTTGRAIGELMR